jgi:pimeloyl-ACP methyl ester carboxylesterase
VHGGILEFGTELVIASDRSIVAMLGPSPGASTAVWIMPQVIERSFPEKLKTGGWSSKLKQMIPSYSQSLIENAALCRQVRAETAAVLNLNNIDQPAIAAFFAMVAGSSVAQKNAAEPQIHSASIGHGITLQAVQRISVPVLILMGAKSYPFLGVIGRELARLLPKSKTIVFPDAGASDVVAGSRGVSP